MKVLTYTNLKTNYKITMKHVKLFEDFVREGKFDKPIKLSVKKSRKNPYTFSHKMDNEELYKLFFQAMGKEVADKEELDGYKDTDYEKARKDIFNIMMSRGANPYRDKRTWADDWEEEEYDIDEQFVNEALHPNLSKKNLAKLKKLGHTGMKSAILWTDGHGSNSTYIQIPGEDGSAWGSKGPEDRTTFYWDGENVWCTNYPKETLRIDYKKSVDTAEEFSDATKSISDSGKWEKVKKM